MAVENKHGKSSKMAPPAPDGGFWGWMAVFACFMGNVIGDGVMYSFGVFIPYIKEHFDAGSGEVSTIYSIQVGVTFASGPIASFMTNRLGWRITTVIGTVLASAGLALSAMAPNVLFLYFSAGLLLGLGLGIIYLPRLDCITQYFDKKRPFVTGIAICGSGLGTFIFAPLTQVLLDWLGWQMALLSTAGICSINCFFGLMFVPIPTEQEEDGEVYDKLADPTGPRKEKVQGDKQQHKETVKVMVELLKHPIFMMFAVSNFFTSLGYPIPYTFVPDNAKVLGMTPEEGSYLVALIGISNTVARVLLGIASQRLNRLMLYNTCLVICGFSMCLSNFFQPISAGLMGLDCSNATESMTEVVNTTLLAAGEEPEVWNWACSQYVGQLIYANVYGVTSAAYVLLTTLVLADLLGAEMFTNSFGLLLLFQGVATFIGPPIVGFMFDADGNYDAGFVLMGLMIALSGFILYPVPCLQRQLQAREERKKYLQERDDVEDAVNI